MTKDNWIKAFYKLWDSEYVKEPEPFIELISQVEKDAEERGEKRGIEKTNKRWRERVIAEKWPMPDNLITPAVDFINRHNQALSDLLEDKK